MIPSNAECYFEDGDKLCCVRGDFVNLEESPAGFGTGYAEAYQALIKDESNKRARFQRDLAQVKRTIASWPLWKQNVVRAALENKPTNEIPRVPIGADDCY